MWSIAMANQSRLLRAVISKQHLHVHPLPSLSDARADIKAILGAFELQRVRRYMNQVHWEKESQEALFADRAEPGLKLENVAAHSWHVADATLLFLDHFEWLNRERCLSLAILHDKLEM